MLTSPGWSDLHTPGMAGAGGYLVEKIIGFPGGRGEAEGERIATRMNAEAQERGCLA